MDSLNGLSIFARAYIITIIGIVGLIIGSFLNVVSLRLLSGESIVFPRSKCPKCQTLIAWYDNIPVLSYLLLLGKCRNCKTPISIQYPIVELSTGVLFIAIVYAFGFTLNTLFLLVLTCGLIVITLTDLREKVIFDITSIPLIPLGLVYNFFDIGNSGLGTIKIPLEGINAAVTVNQIFISALIGAVIGAAFFEIFSRLGLLLVGEYAFGGGDTIIGAALGAWFGWKMIIVILILSFLVQLIVGFPLIILNMSKDKDYKSIAAMGVLVMSMFVPYLGTLLGLTGNFWGALLSAAISLTLAIGGIKVIFDGLRERKSYTFLPFGPALVIAGLVVMFRGQEILNWYLGSNMLN